MKVIMYISNWNAIGGVETFAKNFCKRMSKKCDVTLIYENVANYELVTEMVKYCNLVKLDKKKTYECDIFISSTAWGVSGFEYVESKCYVQVIHADYRVIISGWAFNYKMNPKTTHHVCVGELVKESFEEVTGLKCDAIIHNLLDNSIKREKKIKNKMLSLVTCSRLSGEKGFQRVFKLAKQLEDRKIDYAWDIYGANATPFSNDIVKTLKTFKGVNFKGITTEPFKVINQADYLVQLSDTEGFAYSVYEAMQVKTPCIITPFASGNEQIINGINGYIVPFEMNDIPFDDILRRDLKVPKFKELGTEKKWNDFFDSCMVWYNENTLQVKITAVVQKYKIGEIVTLPKERALSGIERGLCELV